MTCKYFYSKIIGGIGEKLKSSVFRFVLFCLLPVLVGFFASNLQNDAFAAHNRKGARSGKLRIGRSGGLRANTNSQQSVKKESVDTDTSGVEIETTSSPVKKTASITDEDDDIKISSSTKTIELSKLQKERDDLKKQINTLTTQKEMQKKNSKNNAKAAMCSVIGGKSKLIDMQSGVKSQEHKRDRILESVASIEKEIKELDNWIAEHKTKRDEIKAKAEKARIAATATGAAAVATGIGAGAMYMKNRQLKSEEAEAKAGPQINTSGLSSGGLSLQNLAGKIDPGKVMEMGKGILGGNKGSGAGLGAVGDIIGGSGQAGQLLNGAKILLGK